MRLRRRPEPEVAKVIPLRPRKSISPVPGDEQERENYRAHMILNKDPLDVTLEEFDLLVKLKWPLHDWEPPEIIVSSAFGAKPLLTCQSCEVTMQTKTDSSIDALTNEVLSHQRRHWMTA